MAFEPPFSTPFGRLPASTGPFIVSIVSHLAIVLLVYCLSLIPQYARRVSLGETISLISIPAMSPDPVPAEQAAAPAKAVARVNTTHESVAPTSEEITPIPSAVSAPDSFAGDSKTIEGISGTQTSGNLAGASAGTGSTGARGPSRIGSVSQLDNTDFEPLYRPDPLYPKIAKAAGISGYVEVDLLINEKGKVEDCAITAVNGHPSFGTEVMKVLPFWRFPPPRIGGKSVRIKYLYRVMFALN